MTAQTVSNAIQKRDEGPIGFVQQYQDQFVEQLPSHVNPKQWMAVVTGALRKPEIAEAAASNLAAFAGALLQASRLGLEPGTPQFWLTPRKVKGRLEILGIVGYEGLVELMYRAGAISSVIAEVVYANDQFDYQPGLHERPVHKIDWDADDRGALRLAYAYAIMKDGATSKVVVLNKVDIARIKKSSQGSDSQYSPWVNHEASMWLKSSVRQLAKWVPTSAEYRREQLRAAQEVAAEVADRHRVTTITQMPVQEPEAGDGEYIDPVTGEVMEVADPPGDEDGWGEAVKPGQATPQGD